MSNPLSGQERGISPFQPIFECWAQPGFAVSPLQIDYVLGLSV